MAKSLADGNYSKADLALAEQFPIVIEEAVRMGYKPPQVKGKEEVKKSAPKRASKKGGKQV